MARSIGLLSAIEHGARLVLNLQGFASRDVTTSAGRLHVYDVSGDGPLPTIVLLHGLGSGATSLGPLLARLRPYARRLVAPDLPGHGFSGAVSGRLTPARLSAAVAEALDTLLDEPMILVGSSLGGALAVRYARERPARVAGLALISPAGAEMSAGEWNDLRDAFRIDSAADARRLLGRLYHRAPWYMPAFAPSLRDIMKGAAVQDVLDDTTSDLFHAPDVLRALEMPVLLLWGQSERLLPRSALAYFRCHLPPHAVIEEPQGFGHCPHIDDPARLATRLVAFVRTTQGRASWTPAAGRTTIASPT